MLTLYHSTTSVCAIKVRLTLAEKGLDFESEPMDLRSGDQFDPAYLKINPNAVVPTLIHDGRIVIESSVIQHYVEDAWPEPSLLPADPYERARMRLWMKRIDDPIHPACGTITHAIAFRRDFLAKSPEEQAARFAAIPDPARRARQQAVYEQGLDAPIVAGAVKTYGKLLEDMEAALQSSPWLAGPAYSLADAAATPYVNRLDMMDLLDIWAGTCPRVVDWFDRIRKRPSFDAAITHWFGPKDAEQFSNLDPEVPDKVRRILEAA